MVDEPLLGFGTPDEDTALLPLNNFAPALTNFRIVKTGPGILYGFTITNTLASVQFVQVFDSVTLPADGAVPILSKSLVASDATGFNWIPGRTFLVGIVICNSTSQATKTLGLANCLIDSQFV